MINKKLGYYKCDNQEFQTKIPAYIHSVKANKPVQWVFNNEAFSAHDWTVEPELTLDQLYDQRARQLRERYDYVILSYSGGADSHNILMSFLRQGLVIDEIVVNHLSAAVKDRNDFDSTDFSATNYEAEFHLQALPRLRELQPKMPSTKITVVDRSEDMIKDYEKDFDGSWVGGRSEVINASAARNSYLKLDSMQNLLDKDKGVVMILGVDKPRTMIIDGKFYTRFIDRAANLGGVTGFVKDRPNCTVELFYWSPDALPLLAKQAHMVKKWLEANPVNQLMWDRNHIISTTHSLLHERIYRWLLYTTWDNTWFQADKPVLDWSSEYDDWFKKGFAGTRALYGWEQGMKHMRGLFESREDMLNTNHGFADGLSINAQGFCVGTMKNLHPTLRQELYKKISNQ